MKKHEAMFEYIKQYPPAEILYFNAIQEIEGQTGLNTVYSETDIKTYTNGDKVRQYDFAIVATKLYDSAGNSTVNVDNLENLQLFMDWIDSQNKSRIFPDFGANCYVSKIENLYNMPSLSGTNDSGIAKYMFQCRVTYLEKRS